MYHLKCFFEPLQVYLYFHTTVSSCTSQQDVFNTILTLEKACKAEVPILNNEIVLHLKK